LPHQPRWRQKSRQNVVAMLRCTLWGATHHARAHSVLREGENTRGARRGAAGRPRQLWPPRPCDNKTLRPNTHTHTYTHTRTRTRTHTHTHRERERETDRHLSLHHLHRGLCIVCDLLLYLHLSLSDTLNYSYNCCSCFFLQILCIYIYGSVPCGIEPVSVQQCNTMKSAMRKISQPAAAPPCGDGRHPPPFPRFALNTSRPVRWVTSTRRVSILYHFAYAASRSTRNLARASSPPSACIE